MLGENDSKSLIRFVLYIGFLDDKGSADNTDIRLISETKKH